MCMQNNKDEVAKLLKQNWTKKTGYKVLKIINNWWDQPKSRKLKNYVFTPTKEYRPGFNKSNSEAKKPCLINKKLGRGIHVWLSKSEAIKSYQRQKSENWSAFRLVAFDCYKEDLIGATGNSKKHALFRKVFLRKTEYDKAMSNDS